MIFGVFLEVEIEIFRYFRGPEAHFEDFSDFCDSDDVSGANPPPHFEVILHPKPDFLSVVFLMFFGVLCFLGFLRFWVPRGSILGGILTHF